MQDLQMLQDAARTKKMAKLLQDATKQTRTRKCKTFKCCKMLLEDGEARRRRKERQLIDGRPSNAAKKGDETQRRGCKYPTPLCALAKILPETTVRA